MKKPLFGLLPLLVIAALLVPGGKAAVAASPWSGHWETPYVMGNPAFKATLDIRDFGTSFLVVLRDAIPATAWDNPDCHGPARAFGIGSLVDATHMRVAFLWLCSDGSIRGSVRYFRLGGTDDANPANDGIVFCTGLDINCGLVWHRVP